MSHKIVLGISGGIAAYKAPELVRLLVQEGMQVHCILTEHATRFVAPLALATLSGNPVLIGNFESSESGKIRHIELAEIADLILVAPATANVIAKITHGEADDLLTTTILAAQGSVVLCPAMNVFMWENAATQENVRTLQSRGVEIIGPASGELACGYEGLGRMEEPEKIVETVRSLLASRHALKGKKILITAGPTREFLDPVRFLSNPSSGRMGYAIAKAARAQGAEVTLISGPTELAPLYGVKTVSVTTAEEMLEAVEQHFQNCDVFISAAAVSDWKPAVYQASKEKKEQETSGLKLERTPDILATVAQHKKHQILVGFAVETENLETNAQTKLQKKNLDLIVGNLVSNNGHSPFGSEDNQVTFFHRSGEIKAFPRISKIQAAKNILEALVAMMQNLSFPDPAPRGRMRESIS